MAERPKIITAADMDKMTPRERADAVDASIVRSWDDVPEPFRTEVQETARRHALPVAGKLMGDGAQVGSRQAPSAGAA